MVVRHVGFVLGLFVVSAQAFGQPIQGDFEFVVCSASPDVSVQNDSLSQELFRAQRHETLKVFQGWGETRQVRAEDGKIVSFVKVQFPKRESAGASIGWLPEELVKARSQCDGAALPANLPIVDVMSGGLGDPNCCGFPLGTRPAASYHESPRAFASARSGRLHAACDLYHNRGDEIRSVSTGTVIRSLYYFYEGTYALEVKHSGGFVVRYGEVLGRAASSVQQGASVKQGQTIGYMGKTNCCTPMLHFELYSGATTGPLTTSVGRFRRRSDLLNPTAYLDNWQRTTFRDQL